MDECTFTHRCIVETLDGLRDGLTHFSGPSRTAVIYSIKPDDPIHIYDPQNLLAGHEPKFKELYIDTDEWRKKAAIVYDKKKIQQFNSGKKPGVGRADLIWGSFKFCYLSNVVYRTPSQYVLYRPY